MPTASLLLVFGRGLTCADDRFSLTASSSARVRAAAAYARAHAFAGRIVFTGGWAEACEGAPEPPDGSREGDLMLREAQAAGLDRFAELRAETRSRSTLENLLHTVEDGLLDGHVFTPAQPLGLVTHAWHLPRVRFLAGKVLGLRGPALLGVPVTENDQAGARRGERAVHLAARLGLLGTRDADRLLRRERRMVALLRGLSAS
ncbi:YdcF family protein [Actinoplanes friuliensis]|uniref:DUF218 domain-containing protein n=1 Tax=Actinoplanes friuliensis DSM 7358 TaxID=1246995 RepID=U5W4V3_9ACTN|nr:YdcF family protein [Actinoplanes friuliensis]AGZ44233.1 hypothetical protein AFR_29860 [Actinoplanes friuliensis DSM 7358]